MTTTEHEALTWGTARFHDLHVGDRVEWAWPVKSRIGPRSGIGERHIGIVTSTTYMVTIREDGKTVPSSIGGVATRFFARKVTQCECGGPFPIGHSHEPWCPALASKG